MVMRPIRAIGWSRIRLGVFALYFAVLLAIVAIDGVPTGRQTIAVIIVSGLGVTAIGKGWRRFARVILDWLPFTLVLMTYDRTRAVADVIGMSLHESDVVHAERWLCF